MSKERPYRVLIGGGGTGGHVFPAIAIADALKEKNPETELLFVGALGRLEMEKVPQAGYTIKGLPLAGFQRKFSLKNFTFFFKLLVSMIRSRGIVRTFDPHVAVGVGGYASGPILKAAARKRVPVLIQEQNSYAGVTNRLLARSARTICVAYEGMDRFFPAEKIVFTGNPVRRHLAEISGRYEEGLKAFDLTAGRKVCLVVGGSLGARILNQSLMEGMEKLDRTDLQLLWQCGKYYQQEVEGAVKASGATHIRVLPFIHNMELAYGVADVIISRAGAITISELCLIGKPVILVPSSNVAEDHQTRNAEALVSRNAALMVSDHQAREQLVDHMLNLLSDEKKKKELSDNIKQLGVTDASERIAEEVLKLVN
jgi:UDP-N-acetylglucosamine--N-acetylmuramyl-(pentapeptide) pyrophosphoryl-undecaprenol N-acetylglucosamine transferase